MKISLKVLYKSDSIGSLRGNISRGPLSARILALLYFVSRQKWHFTFSGARIPRGIPEKRVRTVNALLRYARIREAVEQYAGRFENSSFFFPYHF